MKKFVPAEKLSKKAKKQLAKRKRVTWGEVNPVTRKPANPKAYNRKKLRSREDEDRGADFFYLPATRLPISNPSTVP